MSDLERNTTKWWDLSSAMRGRGDEVSPTVMVALDWLNHILDTTGVQHVLFKKAERMKADIIIGPKSKGKRKS